MARYRHRRVLRGRRPLHPTLHTLRTSIWPRTDGRRHTRFLRACQRQMLWILRTARARLCIRRCNWVACSRRRRMLALSPRSPRWLAYGLGWTREALYLVHLLRWVYRRASCPTAPQPCHRSVPICCLNWRRCRHRRRSRDQSQHWVRVQSRHWTGHRAWLESERRYVVCTPCRSCPNMRRRC